MSNPIFQTENATDFIENAIKDFLRDKKLSLTNQQYSKLKKLLMIRMLEEDMSYASAYNQLSELVEYRKDYEINANAQDEAEEELIRILGSADTQEIQIPVETHRFKKRFITVLTLLLTLLISVASYQTLRHIQIKTAEMNTVISTEQENEIKDLVSQLIVLEKSRGNDITAASIYNKIKKLDTVTAHGEASSYKKFNRAQYQAAIQFLNQELQP